MSGVLELDDIGVECLGPKSPHVRLNQFTGEQHHPNTNGIESRSVPVRWSHPPSGH